MRFWKLWWWKLTGLIVLAGCSSSIGPAGDDYPHKERAVAEIALASVGADAPDVAPDGKLGKCEQCNGTGEVGDGSTFTKCMKCGGDGRIDENDLRQGSAPAVGAGLSDGEDTPAEVPGTITLHITDVTKRGWPEQWWMEYEKPLTDAGWDVAIEKHAIDEEQAAWIEVCAGGKCWPFFGPITLENVSHLKEQ